FCFFFQAEDCIRYRNVTGVQTCALPISIIIVPAFFAQSNTSFIYGMGDIPEDTREGQDTIQIDEAFDKFTPLVLLVPKGDIAREDKLASELDTLPNIKSIVS